MTFIKTFIALKDIKGKSVATLAIHFGRRDPEMYSCYATTYRPQPSSSTIHRVTLHTTNSFSSDSTLTKIFNTHFVLLKIVSFCGLRALGFPSPWRAAMVYSCSEVYSKQEKKMSNKKLPLATLEVFFGFKRRKKIKKSVNLFN
jgi:hypothetical protein